MTVTWWKSSRSSSTDCVEVAVDAAHVFVRDSKNPSGPVLTLEPDVFRHFIETVKATDGFRATR